MKKELFISQLNAGKKYFEDIDIEGSFINKDLSNLSFENCFIVADFSGANLTKTTFKNCNLKTCIFSYCNLSKSEFEGNVLDDAEFQFVQYDDLRLIENSYYGCDFTTQFLEDIRYTDFPGFHIIHVFAGWFDVILVDIAKRIEVTASSYLNNDAPNEFISALYDMCRNDSQRITKWLCWDDEPGATIWKLTRDKDIINISVLTAKRDSIDINRDCLENEKVHSIEIETKGKFIGFLTEVVKSYDKILVSMGNKNFEKEWGILNHSELNRLKEYINLFKRSNK